MQEKPRTKQRKPRPNLRGGNMKLTKKILIILFVIQLLVPSALAVGGVVKQADFKKNAPEIKVRVDEIEYDYIEENVDYMRFVVASKSPVTSEAFIFEEDEDGFYIMKNGTPSKENSMYIADDQGYLDYYLLDYNLNEKEIAYSQCLYNWTVYSRITEELLIKYGYIKGPATDAYITLKVQDGIYEVTGLYINEMPYEEFIKAVYDDEFDINRFDYTEYNYSSAFYEELMQNEVVY